MNTQETNKQGTGLLLEANIFLSSQETYRILWKPKVFQRVHDSQPLAAILRQTNPFHALQTKFLRSILILFSYLHLSLLSTLLKIYPPKLASTSLLPHTCPMPRNFHFS
jgi:hypothetical protein